MSYFAYGQGNAPVGRGVSGFGRFGMRGFGDDALCPAGARYMGDKRETPGDDSSALVPICCPAGYDYSASEGCIAPPPGRGTTDVAIIQGQLNMLGYGPINGTGIVDGPTKAAVIRFQQTAGIQVDGNPGTQTKKALLAAILGKGAGAGACPPGVQLMHWDDQQQKCVCDSGYEPSSQPGICRPPGAKLAPTCPTGTTYVYDRTRKQYVCMRPQKKGAEVGPGPGDQPGNEKPKTSDMGMILGAVAVVAVGAAFILSRRG